MFSRRLKAGYFVLEGLNSFATVYFFYYFYFYMQQRFGFGNKANLVLAALNGGTYALCAWFGGQFAQRFGYFRALKTGFLLMLLAMAAGTQLATPAAQVMVMLVTVLGMSFTWPTLEALTSEGEPPGAVQHMVGIYNVVWAATAAVANFTGGAMLQKLGPRSLFLVPGLIQLTQLGLTFWLERQAGGPAHAAAGGLAQPLRAPLESGEGFALARAPAGPSPEPTLPQRLRPALPVAVRQRFLRMAWLANPFAYIGINTTIAAMPGIAARLGLSTMVAGFCGSVWCFARLGAFVGLWLWEGWHYRFRWLLLAYVGLVGSFTAVLLAPNVTLLVSAQLLFGVACGLLYYSSLFYSMDRSDTKGEHGGIHEAVIGLGNFAGPALGATTLQFLPAHPSSGPLAVSVLLLLGLGGLTAIWRGGFCRHRPACALAK
jgi:predicted MFS family arabinose efflux permease